MIAHLYPREADMTKERIEKLLKAGANVILTTKGIDDMALKVNFSSIFLLLFYFFKSFCCLEGLNYEFCFCFPPCRLWFMYIFGMYISISIWKRKPIEYLLCVYKLNHVPCPLSDLCLHYLNYISEKKANRPDGQNFYLFVFIKGIIDMLYSHGIYVPIMFSSSSISLSPILFYHSIYISHVYPWLNFNFI